MQSTDEDEENTRILPAMQLHEQLRLQEAQAVQTYNKPPFRYNEATLVKRMEELGIGRPSTYATIIETIQHVHYVERGSVPGTKRDVAVLTLRNGQVTEKQKSEMYGSDAQRLLPTDLGRITNDFLVENFPQILSYDFTAHEEEQFDRVAEGRADWVNTVDTFYKQFHPLVSSIPSGKVEGRYLGEDPETGLPVIAKISKVGPCVQLGDASKDKPRFASLKKGQSIFSITLKEALELFKTALPLTLGEYEGQEVVIGEGKYGPYVRYDGMFITIPRGVDPLTLTMQQAIDLIINHRVATTPVREWGNIQLMRGRFGNYLRTPEGNYQLPKNVDMETLTEDEAKKIIEQSQPMVAAKKAFRKGSRAKG